MSGSGVRPAKAALSGGCKPHPVTLHLEAIGAVMEVCRATGSRRASSRRLGFCCFRLALRGATSLRRNTGRARRQSSRSGDPEQFIGPSRLPCGKVIERGGHFRVWRKAVVRRHR